MLCIVLRQLDTAFSPLSDKCPALGGSTSCRICDSQESEDPTENKNGFLSLLSVPQRIALFCLMHVVAQSRYGEICAISCHHGRLCQTRAWVALLHSRMDTHNSNDNAKGEVEGYKELIEGASGTSEKRVEETGESYCERIHQCRRSNEDPLPEIGGRIVPIFETSF